MWQNCLSSSLRAQTLQTWSFLSICEFDVRGCIGRKAQPGKPHGPDSQPRCSEFGYLSSRHCCNISKNSDQVKFGGFRESTPLNLHIITHFLFSRDVYLVVVYSSPTVFKIIPQITRHFICLALKHPKERFLYRQ